MVTCESCQNDQFENANGLFYCTECHTQAQDFCDVEEGLDGEAVGVSFAARVKKTPIAKAPANKRELPIENEIRNHSYEFFNQILCKQVRALMKLGAQEQYKVIILQIWAQYLSLNGIAFTNDNSDEFIPRIDSTATKRDKKLMEGRDIPDGPTVPDYSHLMRLPNRMTLLKTISFLHIGILISPQTFLFSDIIRWVRQGLVPFYNASECIPQHMRVTNCDYFQLNAPKNFSIDIVYQNSLNLIDYLDLKPLVSNYSVYPVLYRFIRELNLPYDMIRLVKRVIELQPVPQGSNKSRINVLKLFSRLRKMGGDSPTKNIPFSDEMVMAFILFVLKILFSLDDGTEQLLSVYANRLNSTLSQNNRRHFEFNGWLSEAKARHTLFVEAQAMYTLSEDAVSLENKYFWQSDQLRKQFINEVYKEEVKFRRATASGKKSEKIVEDLASTLRDSIQFDYSSQAFQVTSSERQAEKCDLYPLTAAVEKFGYQQGTFNGDSLLYLKNLDRDVWTDLCTEFKLKTKCIYEDNINTKFCTTNYKDITRKSENPLIFSSRRTEIEAPLPWEQLQLVPYIGHKSGGSKRTFKDIKSGLSCTFSFLLRLCADVIGVEVDSLYSAFCNVEYLYLADVNDVYAMNRKVEIWKMWMKELADINYPLDKTASGLV